MTDRTDWIPADAVRIVKKGKEAVLQIFTEPKQKRVTNPTGAAYIDSEGRFRMVQQDPYWADHIRKPRKKKVAKKKVAKKKVAKKTVAKKTSKALRRKKVHIQRRTLDEYVKELRSLGIEPIVKERRDGQNRLTYEVSVPKRSYNKALTALKEVT